MSRDLLLEARKDYFDGAPKLEGIFYRIIPEDLTAIAEFEIGNIDVTGIPAAEYGRCAGNYRRRPAVPGV